MRGATTEQSVLQPATAWEMEVKSRKGQELSPHRPDHIWGQPNLLSTGKDAKGVKMTSPTTAEAKLHGSVDSLHNQFCRRTTSC
jgi:hypothetical protein